MKDSSILGHKKMWGVPSFSLSRKIVGSFVVVAMLAGLTSGLSYYFLNKVNDAYVSLLNKNIAILQLTSEIQYQAQLQSSLLSEYYVDPDKGKDQAIIDANTKLSSLIEEVMMKDQSAENKIYYDSMVASNKTLQVLVQDIVANGNKDSEKAKGLLQRSIPMTQSLTKLIGKIQSKEKFVVDIKKSENEETINQTIQTLIWASIIALVVALAIGILLSRMIVNPMRALVRAAGRIAACDLTVEDIQIRNRDEIQELAIAFNQMKGNLHLIISEVGGHAEQVVIASEELAANSESLGDSSEQITSITQEISLGSESQLHSVNKGVKVIEEMNQLVEQISSVTELTNQKSSHALTAAMDGNESIESAVTQMNSINMNMKGLAESVQRLDLRSTQIVQANEMISDIAKQTNLLALNASIEAARAGEAGKGFAVVAQEVRKLSLKTSDSADEIARLINTIQIETTAVVHSTEAGSKEVTKGIIVVNEAGQAFKHIQEAVKEVAQQIVMISIQSEQIAERSLSAVEAIRSIDHVAQHTASGTRDVSANVEEQFASMQEIVSSSNLLNRMAGELQDLIGKFKV